MRISKKKLFSAGVILILFLVSIIANFSNPEFKDYYSVSRYICIYTLVNLIIIEYILINYEKRVNFFEIFLILCFLFMYGQSYAITFFNELGTKSLFNITSNYFNFDLIYHTSIYVLMFIIALSFGYLMGYNNKANENIGKNNKNISYKNREIVTKLGWIILIISIIPTIYLCYKDFILIQKYGYSTTLTAPTGIDKVLNIFKGFFNSSILMLIISEKGRKKKLSYIILFTYLAFELLGGTRIQAFKFLIIVAVLYLENNKINLRKIVGGITIIFIIAIAFSFISINRTAMDQDISTILKEMKENNVIYNILFECGHTQTLLLVVFSKCPMVVEHIYGLSILRAFLSAIPNLGFWKLHPSMITVDTTFSPLYTDRAGLGGSIFAEAYWNFGIAGGIIFMFLIGIFISNITKNVYKTCDFSKKFMGYYLLFYSSFLVRGDIEQFGRNFVYYCIFPLLIIKIINSYKIKEVKELV